MADAGHFIRYAPNRLIWQMFEDTTGIAALNCEGSGSLLWASRDGAAFTSTGTFSAVGLGVYVKDLLFGNCHGRTDTYFAVAGIGNASALDRAVHPNYGFDGSESGVVVTGTLNSITLRVSALNNEGLFVGSVIELIRGNGQGQSRTIVGYSTGRIATVDPDWTVIPVINDVYVIHPVSSPVSAPETPGLTPADVKAIDGSTTAAVLLKSLYESGS